MREEINAFFVFLLLPFFLTQRKTFTKRKEIVVVYGKRIGNEMRAIVLDRNRTNENETVMQ